MNQAKVFYVRVMSEAYVRAKSEDEARKIAAGLHNGEGVEAHAVRPPQTVIGVWDRHAFDGRSDGQ
jgi:hypothetical protein